MNQHHGTSVLSDFGRRVRSLREQQHRTQTDVAAASGMATSRLSLVESGRADLRVTQVLRLAEALGVPVIALLEDKPRRRIGVGRRDTH